VICVAGVAVTFFLILTQLSNRNWRTTGRVHPSFFEGFAQVFKEGHNLKRWLIISSLTGMEMGMVTPYIQPYANQFKGADQFVLGAMVTAGAVVPLVLGIPFGRLSDKVGRKKVIYLTALPVVASYVMLIYAPNAGFLIASGALQGFFMVTGIVTTAMSRELVPAEQMGRWTGILGFFRMGVAAIMTYACGLIWDYLGPQYVFWFVIVFYVIRLPLLVGMPETLTSGEKRYV
jgi:MFS family permease